MYRDLYRGEGALCMVTELLSGYCKSEWLSQALLDSLGIKVTIGQNDSWWEKRIYGQWEFFENTISGLIKNKGKHIKLACKLCSMPTNKIGQIVEGMGARLEYRAKGSSIPSHIYIGTSAFCLLQLLCNVVCRFFFFPFSWFSLPLEFLSTIFYPCGSVIREEGGPHTAICFMHTQLYFYCILVNGN